MNLQINTMREWKGAGGYQGPQTASPKHSGQLLINNEQLCKAVTIQGPCCEGEEIPLVLLPANDLGF